MSAANANLSRRLLDQSLEISKALPAANAANASDPLNLGQKVLGPAGDHIEAELFIEATPNLANSIAITMSIKDSADGTNFTAIAGLGTLVVTGGGGVGAAAATQRVRLPSHTRQYVRADAAVANTGGDNTAKKYGLRIFSLA